MENANSINSLTVALLDRHEEDAVQQQTTTVCEEEPQETRLKKKISTQTISTVITTEDDIESAHEQEDGDEEEEEENSEATGKAPLYVCILLFLSAAGSTVGWTSVLSNLVYYTDTLGPDSYIYLNLCVQGPLLPVILLQTYLDDTLDRKVFRSSHKGFQWRANLSFAVVLLSTIAMPFCSQQESLLLVIVASLIMGVSSAVLHGALKQLAALVYPGCGRLPAAVTAGLQASAVAVLFVNLWSPLSIETPQDLYVFYGAIAVLLILCWLCFHALVSYCPHVQACMEKRDQTLQLLLCSVDDDNQEENEDDQYIDEETGSSSASSVSSLAEPLLSTIQPQQQPQPTTISRIQILCQSWPLFLALTVNVILSRTIMSWFNRVPSASGHHNLPQVLFYTRLFADLMARPATLLLQSSSANTVTNNTTTTNNNNNKRPIYYLLTLVLLRLPFVPYFFCYTMPDRFPWILLPRNDIIIIIGVFLYCFSSGFVITWVYQLGPLILNQGDPATLQQARLQQTNLLNACLGASMLIGILASLSLSKMFG